MGMRRFQGAHWREDLEKVVKGAEISQKAFEGQCKDEWKTFAAASFVVSRDTAFEMD